MEAWEADCTSAVFVSLCGSWRRMPTRQRQGQELRAAMFSNYSLSWSVSKQAAIQIVPFAQLPYALTDAQNPFESVPRQPATAILRDFQTRMDVGQNMSHCNSVRHTLYVCIMDESYEDPGCSPGSWFEMDPTLPASREGRDVGRFSQDGPQCCTFEVHRSTLCYFQVVRWNSEKHVLGHIHTHVHILWSTFIRMYTFCDPHSYACTHSQNGQRQREGNGSTGGD